MMRERRRMLIFGARGFVGGWLAAAAKQSHEVLLPSPGARIDITDAAACARAIEESRPDVVFLTAALADIDRCERDPVLAEQVNVAGPRNVARACKAAGARLVFTSSGAVFDGTRPAYTEEDPVSPVSVYGKSKARAEAAVLDEAPEAVVVRLSLVLGLAADSAANAVVNKFLASWQAGKPVVVPAGEYRNAIDAAAVAALLVELGLCERARGIYHIGSTNPLSRLEIARRLAQAFAYPSTLVIPQTTPPEGRAPRGRFEFLLADRIAALFRTRMPSCEEAIERCVHATTQSNP